MELDYFNVSFNPVYPLSEPQHDLDFLRLMS